MRKKITRRKVLEGGLKGSLIAFGGAAGLAPGGVQAIWAKVKEVQGRGSAVRVLSALERANLLSAANEIIPATGGMPSAGKLGATNYIEIVLGEVKELRKQVQAGLNELEQSSQLNYSQTFSRLTSEERVKLLKIFDKKSAEEEKLSWSGTQPDLFATMRDLVYEAYYTNPQVWSKIGYEFYGTNNPGPEMKSFDETILENVRRKPKFYREVD